MLQKNRNQIICTCQSVLVFFCFFFLNYLTLAKILHDECHEKYNNIKQWSVKKSHVTLKSCMLHHQFLIFCFQSPSNQITLFFLQAISIWLLSYQMHVSQVQVTGRVQMKCYFWYSFTYNKLSTNGLCMGSATSGRDLATQHILRTGNKYCNTDSYISENCRISTPGYRMISVSVSFMTGAHLSLVHDP